MKPFTINHKLKMVLLLGIMILALSSCFFGDDEEIKPGDAVENSMGDAQQQAQDVQNKANETADETADETQAELNDAVEGLSNNTPAMPQETTTVPDQATEASTLAQTNTSAPSLDTSSSSQVVWYVTAHKLNVRQSPSSDAAVVAKLEKGHRIIATIEGDWAKLSNGYYVSSKFISQKPQGYIRTRLSWASQRK